ncbi:MAG: hypothetical protein WCA12_19600 [Burkholderiales bacterium]
MKRLDTTFNGALVSGLLNPRGRRDAVSRSSLETCLWNASTR